MKSRTLSLALLALVAVAAIISCVWGGCHLGRRALAGRALHRYEELSKKGYDALAEDVLDGYRRELSRRPDGCVALLAAYFKVARTDRLEWTAEACLDQGHEIPEAYLGLSQARLAQNRDADALSILQAAEAKFPKMPDFEFRMAQIYQRAKQNDPAVAALLKAHRTAPDNKQITLAALQFLSSISRWEEAREMADSLKSVPLDNPEFKLLVARALQHGGDLGSARVLVADAKRLMASKPGQKAALSKEYGDVLGEAGGDAKAE